MSWTLVRATWPELPPDTSPLLEIYRAHGVENTAEDEATITGCVVDGEAGAERLHELTVALEAEGATVETGPYEEVDWNAQWRAHFKPRRIGRRFIVRPTWEAVDALPPNLVITLDPGEAFGTGDHPTTRMCLAALEDAVRPETAVLDLGCGSGILAIGAKKLGAREVVGVDIEPVSVAVARTNGEMNHVEIEWRVGDVLEELPGRQWNVVVSNIISATLISLSPLAAQLVAAHGIWIVSGIIAANWEAVRAAAEREGFVYVSHEIEGEWTCGVFHR